jgi:hypothetical protein
VEWSHRCGDEESSETSVQPISTQTVRPVRANSILLYLHPSYYRRVRVSSFPRQHPGLSSQELESVQKRAMRIIFPFRPYNEVLHESGLIRLSERRQAMEGDYRQN